jgi:sulfate transport system substrate-binding protein
MTQFRKSIAAVLLGLVASAALADTTLLNVSYDVARDVYKDYNPMFQKYGSSHLRV